MDAASSRPNILILYADDWRHDTLGCAGNATVKTPNIDRLAADGFRFTGSSAVAEFERGFAVLEGLRCDVLLTPHPGASGFWERIEAGAEKLIDGEACKRYAAAGRRRLAQRLEAEAARP